MELIATNYKTVLDLQHRADVYVGFSQIWYQPTLLPPPMSQAQTLSRSSKTSSVEPQQPQILIWLNLSSNKPNKQCLLNRDVNCLLGDVEIRRKEKKKIKQKQKQISFGVVLDTKQ